MALQLGLEALSNESVSGENDILSYRFLDSVFKYNLSSEELAIMGNELEQVMVAAENLTAIGTTIQKYSVTESLVALVGDSFPAGISYEAIKESMAKAYNRVKEWCIAIWRKIKELISYWFNGAQSLSKKLGVWISTATTNRNLKNSTKFKGLSSADITIVKNAIMTAGTTQPTDADAEQILKSNKETKYELAEITINDINDAIAYARACKAGLDAVATKKTAILANCDKWVNDLKSGTAFKIKGASGELEKEFNTEAGKDNKELSAKIKKIKNATMSAQIVVNRGSRALQHSAAAFLTHMPLKKDAPNA